jgi:hypothetical protein
MKHRCRDEPEISVILLLLLVIFLVLLPLEFYQGWLQRMYQLISVSFFNNRALFRSYGRSFIKRDGVWLTVLLNLLKGQYATSRKVAGSSPDQVTEFLFSLPNPSSRAMVVDLTQSLIEMSTRKCSWGVESGRSLRLITSTPSASRLSRN